jgi:hypothetical protein
MRKKKLSRRDKEVYKQMNYGFDRLLLKVIVVVVAIVLLYLIIKYSR